VSRGYADYLQDILDEIRRAQRSAAKMTLAEFAADEMRVYATVRALEILREAAKHIPAEIRERESEIPWREMTGMRDVMNHAYPQVDLEIVWRTFHQRLPRIEPLVARALVTQRHREEDENGS
jgi:uncharacterized protein with HEPN domain